MNETTPPATTPSEAKAFLGDEAAAINRPVTRSTKTEEAVQLKTAELRTQEAAQFTEDILTYFNDESIKRDLDAPQRIFAITLALINLRQHYPMDMGGKAYFDEVGHAAWEYFSGNSPTADKK